MREFVKRAVGFTARDDTEFVADVTVKTADGGYATVQAFGATAWGAAARAKAAAARKMTSRRRATGFTAEGFRTANRAAAFAVGFA